VQVASLVGHTGAVYAIEPLTQGLLASASADMSIIIWNLTTQLIQQQIQNAHAAKVWRLVMLSNGKLASAGGGSDNCVKTWDLSTYATVKSNCNFTQIQAMIEVGTKLVVTDSVRLTIFNETTLASLTESQPGTVLAVAGSDDNGNLFISSYAASVNYLTYINSALDYSHCTYPSDPACSYMNYSQINMIDRYLTYYFTADNASNVTVWDMGEDVVSRRMSVNLQMSVANLPMSNMYSMACLNNTGNYFFRKINNSNRVLAS
jgi:WD40 repeat protein